MRVVFLGTSCAVPTRERSLPATALIHEGRIILFDCGEGAQRQLIMAGLKLTRVQHVLVSHLHADHVLGLPGLVISRSFIGGTEPLHVYGPAGIDAFLRFLLRQTDAHLGYELVVHESDGGLLWEDEAFTLRAEPLKHRSPCLGYLFAERDRPGRFDAERAKRLGIPPGPLFGRLKAGEEIQLPDGRIVRGKDLVGAPIPGRRVAYVMDTVPCPGAYRLAAGADLLIYESTYAPGSEQESKDYWHSTSLQALKIARRAGAQRLALTHFSPRYKDARVFLEGLGETEVDVLLAEDFAEIEIPRRKPESQS